jgi:hypothetical protein
MVKTLLNVPWDKVFRLIDRHSDGDHQGLPVVGCPMCPQGKE